MIKLFISDVDGVMTDGGMYYLDDGREFKKFHVHDGVGFIKLRENGIKTAILTTSKTEIISKRAKVLNVDYFVEGTKNKLAEAKKICAELNITLDEVAFIGDDVWDVELLKNVGFPACPADAQECVKSIPNICVLNLNGGCGCVREFIEILNEK